jgi:hypothetical protein
VWRGTIVTMMSVRTFKERSCFHADKTAYVRVLPHHVVMMALWRDRDRQRAAADGSTGAGLRSPQRIKSPVNREPLAAPSSLVARLRWCLRLPRSSGTVPEDRHGRHLGARRQPSNNEFDNKTMLLYGLFPSSSGAQDRSM